MASLFSASDTRATVTAAVCVLWCLGLAPVTPVQGTLQIPQCSAQGWLEIRPDQTEAVATCTGLESSDTFEWQLIKGGDTITVTCDASDQCNSTSDDIRTIRVDRGNTSDLHIGSNHRTLAGNSVVKCLYPNWTNSAVSCKTNVISPAVLTHCKLVLTTEGTVAGTCNFTNLYSSNDTYSCTWTVKQLDGQGDPDAIIPGTIHKTNYTSSGNAYYRGTCSFLSWLRAGQYNYTVRFSPGGQYQGTQTVPAPPTTTTTTPTTTTTTPTTPTTNSSQSPGPSPISTSQSPVPPATTEETSTTVSVTGLTCKSTSTKNAPGFPLGAVVGGVVGGVVVLAVVVVVVVIVIRRKRAKPAKTKTVGDDVEYFEEHVNTAYVSSADEDQDPSPPPQQQQQQQQPKPSGVALRIPSTTTTTTTTTTTATQSSTTSPTAGQPATSPTINTPTPTTPTNNDNDNIDPDYDYSTIRDDNEDDEDDIADAGYSSVSFHQAARPLPGSGVGEGQGQGKVKAAAKVSFLAAPARDFLVDADGDYSAVDLNGDQAGGGDYSSVGDVASEPGPTALLDRKKGGGGDGDDGDGDDVYAQVDKSAKRRDPQPAASGGDDGRSGDGDDAYAQVDKSAKRRDPQPAASGGDDGGSGGGDDVYAQVDKSAKRRAPAQPAAVTAAASTTPPDNDNNDEDYAHLDHGYTGRGGAPAAATAPPPISSEPISDLDDSTCDEYAHLDHGLHGATAGAQLTGSPQAGPALTDVYARVDKSSQGNNLTPSPPQTAEPEGHVYAHPPKPRPLIKPKPALK